MKFSGNREILTDVIEERAAIRHVSKHRNPDGSMDVEGNLKLWNSVMERFERINLWEDGAPGFDNSNPLHPEPNIIFIPAPEDKLPSGCIVVAHGGGFSTRTGCEGFNVADFFNRQGFAVAILTYRLIPYSRFDALADMQRAIRLIRSKRMSLESPKILQLWDFLLVVCSRETLQQTSIWEILTQTTRLSGFPAGRMQ